MHSTKTLMKISEGTLKQRRLLRAIFLPRDDISVERTDYFVKLRKNLFDGTHLAVLQVPYAAYGRCKVRFVRSSSRASRKGAASGNVLVVDQTTSPRRNAVTV